MKPADGSLTPIWYRDAEIADESGPPPGSLRTDVAVVGAGIAGLLTAYRLVKAGKSVMVVDEGAVASGQTGRTSAHLASQNDDYFQEIERILGLEASKVAYESHAAGIDWIEQVATEAKIDCDFKRIDGYLFATPEGDAEFVRKEFEAAKRAGFRDVEFLANATLAGCPHGPALRFGNQARFHPLKFMAGLANELERLGVRIYTGCRATTVSGGDGNTSPKVTVGDGTTTIEAAAVVVATNTPAPINDWLGIYLKQASYRSYMLGFKIAPGAVADMLWWDTVDPYHYVRLEHDVLLVGGADHKVGQFPDVDPFQTLEAWTRQNFTTAGVIVSRWSGQVQEPADLLGFVGVAPTSGTGVYVITGDSGMGLTHAALGSILLTDLIQGKANPWTKTYDPTRKHLDSDLVKENANTAIQYKDLITGGDVKTPEQIPAGSGAVLRRGLHKVAVYRRPDGSVKECSAVCTHLACIVQWNPAEKSWDCPCHGSRFDPEGKVLIGPAVTDLADAGG